MHLSHDAKTAFKSTKTSRWRSIDEDRARINADKLKFKGTKPLQPFPHINHSYSITKLQRELNLNFADNVAEPV